MFNFSEYIRAEYNIPGSGTADSYLRAIKIIDELFRYTDIFNLSNLSLFDLKDPILIDQIVDFIIDEENKFRNHQKSFFDNLPSKKSSYPNKGFCRAAVKKLRDYINLICQADVVQYISENENNGMELSRKLTNRFKINNSCTEQEVRAKRRMGQNIFRNILLSIYDSKCCLSGLEIPEVLRASHIVPWAECEESRLDPTNGLCLSATYDAAFDKNLITFDQDYRLVLSPFLKEHYTSESFKKHFIDFEGKKLREPSIFLPSQTYLERHREKLLV